MSKKARFESIFDNIVIYRTVRQLIHAEMAGSSHLDLSTRLWVLPHLFLSVDHRCLQFCHQCLHLGQGQGRDRGLARRTLSKSTRIHSGKTSLKKKKTLSHDLENGLHHRNPYESVELGRVYCAVLQRPVFQIPTFPESTTFSFTFPTPPWH